MEAIGPQVPIRALRLAYGLTLPMLAERIGPLLGRAVDEDSLSNIERGNKRGSALLMNAWARALGLSPLDITQPEQTTTESAKESAA